MIELKSRKMSVLDTFRVCLCVWGVEGGVEGGVGGGWGMDGGSMPLPTHPLRYCDPVLLVLYAFDVYSTSISSSLLYCMTRTTRTD